MDTKTTHNTISVTGICPTCHTTYGIFTNEQFCHQDGTRLIPGQIPCSSCGRMVMVSHKYCEYCGAQMQVDTKSLLAVN
jgi:RNA polymerase subunit RPABC4/transcription elongation factor Spt4